MTHSDAKLEKVFLKIILMGKEEFEKLTINKEGIGDFWKKSRRNTSNKSSVSILLLIKNGLAFKLNFQLKYWQRIKKEEGNQVSYVATFLKLSASSLPKAPACPLTQLKEGDLRELHIDYKNSDSKYSEVSRLCRIKKPEDGDICLDKK